MNRLVTSMDGLAGHVGTRLGPTDWAVITQEQVDQFAALTRDHYFLHVDPVRACATAVGSTIAHGYLTLSLVAPVTLLLEVVDATMGLNYGLDRVRFPAPLPVGAQWRGTAQIVEVDAVKGAVHVKMLATVHVKSSARPAVVAECLFRYYR